jgi:hypothetical protein
MLHKLFLVCLPRFWGFDVSPPLSALRGPIYFLIQNAVLLRIVFQWFGFFIGRKNRAQQSMCIVGCPHPNSGFDVSRLIISKLGAYSLRC